MILRETIKVHQHTSLWVVLHSLSQLSMIAEERVKLKGDEDFFGRLNFFDKSGGIN